MMRRKGRKSSKRRGHTTHGYGSMKKHRGAGSRGGRGMAGTGKRADQKKSRINPAIYFGKSGFRSRRKPLVVVNVQHLTERIDAWQTKKCIEKSGKGYCIDLTKAGIDKLLGAGSTSVPLTIKVAAASSRAIAKIKKAGGSVELTKAASSTDDSKGAAPEEDKE